MDKLIDKEKGICPYCGSMQIGHDDDRVEADILIYKVFCYDCKQEWEEVYKIKFIGNWSK
jgi:hypothetical protein